MKRISKSKQKGLSKLPEEVVNRFGYTKENMKAKYGTGKMLTKMKYGTGDMSIPMQAKMRGGEGNVPKTSAEYIKREQAKYGKSKMLPKNKQGPLGDGVRAAISMIPGIGTLGQVAEGVKDSYGNTFKEGFMSLKQAIKDVYNEQMRDPANIILKETTGTEGMNLFNKALSELDDITDFKKAGGAKKARYGVSMQTPGKKKGGKKGKKTTTRRKKK